MNNLAQLPLKPWQPSRLIWILSGVVFLIAANQGIPGDGDSTMASPSPMLYREGQALPYSEENWDILDSGILSLDLNEAIRLPELDSSEDDLEPQATSSLRSPPISEASPQTAVVSCVTETQEPVEVSKVPQPLKYKVRRGDSLWKVSQQFNIDPESLAAANGLNVNRYLQTGQILLIPPGKGVYHAVKRGESVWQICQGYGVDANRVIEENRIENPSQLQEGQKLFLPGARPKKKSVEFIWPVRGRLTSGYGYRQHPMGGQSKFHCGIDIAAPVGRTIYAAMDGKVLSTGRRGSLGLAVVIQHDEQYSTIYGHASSILVRSGQQVKQGDPIALVGNTGLSTGPHLHFEIRKSGRAINPRPLLP